MLDGDNGQLRIERPVLYIEPAVERGTAKLVYKFRNCFTAIRHALRP